MAERRRTTPKSRGKAISIDTAPSELPEDLPKNFPYQYSWEMFQKDKMVLLEIIDQGDLGSCWTISFNRMIGAHLFIHNKVRLLLRFSARHLYAQTDEKFSNGFLKNYKGLKTFLKDDGLVREEDCKCVVGKDNSTVACDKVKDKKVFKVRDFIIVEKNDVNETDLIHLLKTRGPIAVEIEVTFEYKKDGSKGKIYYGPSKNLKGWKIVNHIVLLTGYNTDPSGVSYFKFQNTWGVKWGENGYGKLARKVSLPNGEPSLIKSYMYPELLDQIMDV